MAYGRRSYGARRKRRRITTGFARRKRASTMRMLNKAGVVHKTVKVVSKDVPNVLQVQCQTELQLKQPYEWNYGTATQYSPAVAASLNHLDRHYAAPVYAPADNTEVLAGASIPYAHFVPYDTSADGYAKAEKAYEQHTKAARAYVMNFGSDESQPLRTNSNGQLVSTLADHWYSAAAPGTAAQHSKTKHRYMEDSLPIIQLNKGRVRSVRNYDMVSSEELVEVSSDDFEGAKIYAKTARLRMNFTVRPPLAMNVQERTIQQQQGGSSPKATVVEANSGLGKPHLPAASSLMETSTWDNSNVNGTVNRANVQLHQLRQAWVAAGAKIKVRYMRVLQLEHSDERHDPDVGHDLFRDWDGQTTFGLLGDDNSPSYHRYMEAQVNKKYYKIIKHKFFTMQAPRGMIQMMVPTYFPLLHSWNTMNIAKLPDISHGPFQDLENVTLPATGEVATNQINVASETTAPTTANMTHIIGGDADHPHIFPNDDITAPASASMKATAIPTGTGYTMKQGFTPQRVTFGKGNGETSLKLSFNYNKAITMYQSGFKKDGKLIRTVDQAAVDSLLDVENPQLLWEPYTKKTRNHKMICIFEPQGIDPKLFSRAQWFMPSISLNVEGHFVYSSQ